MQTLVVKEQWSNSSGFLVSAIGSAIGLGNLWGFAYRASQGGGVAFVLLYTLIVSIICLPILVAEIVLGKNTSSSALQAPVKLGGTNWMPLGLLFFVAPLGIASYYSVIMGWTADTFFHSLFFGLPQNLTEAENFFSSISSGSSVLLGHLLSLIVTAVIVASGVKNIEKINRYSIILLFIMLFCLAIWATSLIGVWEGYRTFLFKFDFNELRNPQTIRNAFTQAFFSLSLGVGVMTTYGSYLSKKTNIAKLGFRVALFDTLAGLIAGLITFPIVLTFGLSDAISDSTVGALFISIPTGLGSYGAVGRIVAVAFYGLAYIAAITSAVSLMEVPVSALMDKFNFQRGKAVWLVSLFLFLAGIPSALNLNILGTVDSIFGGVLLIFGGFLVTFFMGWVVPTKLDEELKQSGVEPRTIMYLKLMIRWIASPIIGFVLFISVFDLLKGWVS